MARHTLHTFSTHLKTGFGMYLELYLIIKALKIKFQGGYVIETM